MKMKDRILIFLIIILTAISLNEANAFFDNTKATIKVVDEAGEPIEAARVGIGFEENTGWGTSEKGVTGLTDSEGIFRAAGQSNGHIGFNVRKEGWYLSTGSYDFQSSGPFGWQPRNPMLTIVLRKIENPVPMYARNSEFSKVKIPVFNEEVGFDLIVYDWVFPYGEGVVNDFTVYAKKSINSITDFKFEIFLIFKNIHDGMIPYDEDLLYGSIFKLPRMAPLEGYVNQHKIYIRKENNTYETSYFDNKSYIFRIRSTMSDYGLVVGLYGKVLGDFDIETTIDGDSFLRFKYYLNPDGSRNLEFDPKRNLFIGLSRIEQNSISRMR